MCFSDFANISKRPFAEIPKAGFMENGKNFRENYLKFIILLFSVFFYVLSTILASCNHSLTIDNIGFIVSSPPPLAGGMGEGGHIFRKNLSGGVSNFPVRSG